MASLGFQKFSNEEDGRPRLELVTEPEPSEATPPTSKPSPNTAAIFGVLRAVALILSVRLLLLLTLVGAVALALMAMLHPMPETMAVLAIYCILAVLPMVWLERTAAARKG